MGMDSKETVASVKKSFSSGDNFRTAVKELFGGNKSDGATIKMNEITRGLKMNTDIPQGKEIGSESPKPVEPKIMGGKPVIPAETNGAQDTVITADTILEGCISSKSGVKVYGRIKGNITSEKNITVYGRVEGDIKAGSISLNDGKVQGNLTSGSVIYLNAQSVVVGDVATENIETNGKIKGNIKAGGAVSLISNAMVVGDIVAHNISIQDGAVLKGKVEVIYDASGEKDIFGAEANT